MNLVYLTYKEIPVGPNSGVLRTQVYDLLKALAVACPNVSISWVLIIPKNIYITYSQELDLLSNEAKGNGLNIRMLVVTETVLLKYLHSFLRLVVFSLSNAQIHVIHCRSYWPTFFALLARAATGRKFKVIFDPRGVYPEEQAQCHNLKDKSWFFKFLKWQECFCLQWSDKIVCISRELCEHYQKIVSEEEKYDVIGPLVDCKKWMLDEKDLRFKRSDFGLKSDQKIFLFSGNFDTPWAFTNTTGTLIKIIAKNPQHRILFLTNSLADKVRMHIEKLGVDIEKVVIFSPKAADIPHVLPLVDFGLLIRDDNIVNRVAFPIKFLEYMAAGVPCIVTVANKVIFDIVQKNHLGIAWDVGEITTFEIDDNMRKRCRNFAQGNDISMKVGEYSLFFMDIVRGIV